MGIWGTGETDQRRKMKGPEQGASSPINTLGGQKMKQWPVKAIPAGTSGQGTFSNNYGSKSSNNNNSDSSRLQHTDCRHPLGH